MIALITQSKSDHYVLPLFFFRKFFDIAIIDITVEICNRMLVYPRHWLTTDLI